MFDLNALTQAYFERVPDTADVSQCVKFGTSGHRGSSANCTYNEAHILAITQAVVDYRTEQCITGPLFVGKDTHGLSEPAMVSVLQVLVANGVQACVDAKGGFTPTPLVSRAILAFADGDKKADGIIITPSHNPPEDGGIKYNTPDGGPAASTVTNWIESRANALLAAGLDGVNRVSTEEAIAGTTPYDYVAEYVGALDTVIDMAAIKNANINIGVDPMGGAGLAAWEAIGKAFDLNLTVTNAEQTPSFEFMPPDHDGKIRMDCSSPDAMRNLLAQSDTFDIALANDPDADRHGIVDSDGLLNPNHFLAVCIDYLLTHRDSWSPEAKVGKTLVSSAMIDRVVSARKRTLYEVPVGFKWFVDGLYQGDLVFGGEESAGASLLTFDMQPWSTDKDGIVLCLLAAEILAVTGKTPHQYYADLTKAHGQTFYKRVDSPATLEQKQQLSSLTPDDIHVEQLGGEPILGIMTNASGNGAAIGGLKIETANAWVAMRPSGTENLCKVYGESFISEAHLDQLIKEASQLIS